MSLRQVIVSELSSILRNPVVMLTMFGGVLFYAFLYPLPYLQQTPLEQPVTVVNLDKSQLSYQLERMADATPEINLLRRDQTLEEAKQAVLRQEVSGILLIPENFYRDLLLGRSPVLSFAGDASYFLVYGSIVNGLSQVAGTLSAQVKVKRLLNQGTPMPLAVQHYSSFTTNLKPTFNPEIGYIDYVVPAVFILILQQTLAMSIGLYAATPENQLREVSGSLLMVVRCGLFCAFYYLLSLFYFGFSFVHNGISQLGEPLELLTLLFPFLLSTCFIGLFIGSIVPKREWVTVLVLISSMPLIFAAGFIWPVEALPTAIVWLSNLFPSTPAIQGFLKLNQMGAEWWQIAPQWQLLNIQMVGWGVIAFWRVGRKVGSR